MARLTIYHRSPIIYRYVIRGVPGDESTNVGQYLVVRFVLESGDQIDCSLVYWNGEEA